MPGGGVSQRDGCERPCMLFFEETIDNSGFKDSVSNFEGSVKNVKKCLTCNEVLVKYAYITKIYTLQIAIFQNIPNFQYC